MTACRTILALLIAAAPIAAGAQERPRDLQVPAGSTWGHAASGLALPSRIAGFTRTGIVDTGTEELDVVAQYGRPDGAVATVYVFRSQVPSAALWFDRSRTVLEQLRLSRKASAPVASTGFALPGRSDAAGLRATYPFGGDGFRSTGVAVAQANGWLVKVRMSGAEEPPRLDAELAGFIDGIRWPTAEAGSTSAAVAPIPPCADKLPFRRARKVKPDIGQALLGSIIAGASMIKAPDPTRIYCREAAGDVAFGTYRLVGTQDSYILAIADSGRAISVGPVQSVRNGDFGKGEDYGVTLLDLGRSATYTSFNRMPEPKQAFQTVTTSAPLSSTGIGSKTMQINLNGDAKR